MKRLIIPITAIVCSVYLQSCKNKSDQNNSSASGTKEVVSKTNTQVIDGSTSQNALDWAGTYEGTVPCADCPGIKTVISLYPDETFSYKADYLDKNTTVQDTGKFMWHNNGSVVHLTGLDLNTMYKVTENAIIQLDTEGKEIEGGLAKEYILNKIK